MHRLPTSLHWLIEKRGRIDGSIQKIESYLDRHQRAFKKYQDLTNNLLLLKETLASVDSALQLHKLKVDPQFIPTIHGLNDVTDLRYGELTQFILERLEIGKGQSVSSREIVDFILERMKTQGKPPVVKSFLSRRVHNQLKNLFRKGKVVRFHPQKTQRCGWWTLAPSFSLNTQTKDDILDSTP